MSNFLAYMHSHIFLYIFIAIVASIIIFLISRKYFENIYLEAPSFRQIKNTKYNNNILYFFVFVGISFFIWIVFIPLGFGHRDEIALLPEIIGPTMYSGRFFPLGHQEFNFLSLTLTNGSLATLYIFSFVELVLFIFLVDKIVDSSSLFIRTFIFVSSLCCYIVSVSNLIIPERNAILFFLVGIYFLQKYYHNQKITPALFSIIAFSLSLYYKEPVFATLFSFIFVFIIGKYFVMRLFTNEKIKFSKLINSLELSLLVSAVLFVMGYLFYTYYNGAPTSYYGKVSITGVKQLLYYATEMPILSLFLFTIALGLVVFKNNTFESLLAIALSSSAIVYCVELIVLGLYLNGYYWSLPLILGVISLGLLFKNIVFTDILKNKVVIVLFSCVVVLGGLVGYKFVPAVWTDIKQKKNYQAEYNFLEKSLSKQKDIKSLYYVKEGNYGDYATAILMIFVHKTNIDHEFTIYSDTGCAVWNESYNGGKIKCVKKEYDINDNYDTLVIENHLVNVDSTKYETYKYLPQFDSQYANSISVGIQK